MTIRVEPLAPADFEPWIALRAQLWPHHSPEELRRDAVELMARECSAVFVASDGTGLAGFAEATLRVDYVNGTSTSPVTFLEGLYVVPRYRRQGVARSLCDAVERWGARAGCTEFASDSLLENEDGRAAHAALGFIETERVAYFLKSIRSR